MQIVKDASKRVGREKRRRRAGLLVYTEMPGLSRELIEHRLSIKASFRPYKRGARNFKPKIIGRVMEEVDRLLQVAFIQPCRYADWVSNIVSMEKKNKGKVQICVAFRNLNRAISKDEYPMPVADAPSLGITSFLVLA
jgi:hypothetical protein